MYSALAEKALAGQLLSEDECYQVLHTPDTDILKLLDAAYEVRRRTWGNRVQLHMLVNAKSGLCPEDCNYCSQSKLSVADIPKYPLLTSEKLLEGAERARESQCKRYCIVTSGRGPTDQELNHICESVRRIKESVDIDICCSVGLITRENAQNLKAAGVNRLNHNLNTSEDYYPQICTTHTYRDRMATLEAARFAGLELCSGAIFGQGESDQDIVSVAMALRELGPNSLPVNFLHPIPGTPFSHLKYMTPFQCLRILCLMRFVCPKQEIRVAGGRELNLGAIQPLALYPANSIFVSGYLTTSGQGPQDAFDMIREAGFEIDL